MISPCPIAWWHSIAAARVCHYITYLVWVTFSHTIIVPDLKIDFSNKYVKADKNIHNLVPKGKILELFSLGLERHNQQDSKN
jgi:hypothetical protein